MKRSVKYLLIMVVIASTALLLSSFYNDTGNRYTFKFPYKHAGLTERQAAAHLLSRFTYGPTPGQIDAVVNEGLENWFQKQLNGNLPDDSLNQLLGKFDALKLSNKAIVQTFPKGGQVTKMVINEGLISKDSVRDDKKAYKDFIANYMQQKGLRPEQELFRQFINQKILRAAYSNNQLEEVMTGFWFNHFNVSITKNDCAQFIPAYERDVIRPNALGKFSDLLLATAKSPAMLYYLDNFSSSGANDTPPANATARRALVMNLQNTMPDSARRAMLIKLQKAKNKQGLNENYAREVMELHTLGVDGGYTQQDVTQAAKVLTGWSIYPLGTYGNLGNLLSKFTPEQLAAKGFVRDSDFMFNPNRHDKSEKVVLGQHFGPNGGYDEGVQLLNMLAHNKATAKFISRKLAVRFVNDNPSQSLINKMAKTFLDQDGDIKQVLITMVSSPDFWNAAAVREKTKSPFELAIGAVRALNADIQQPYQLFNWINRMGEKIYYYQAPTGFPDKAQYWINTGALLNRMNFGLAIASGRIPGVKIDLAALNNHREPESAQAALVTYSKLIMPERNLDETIKRLTPMLTDPNLVKKVDEASAKTVANPDSKAQSNTQPMASPTMGGDMAAEIIVKPKVAPVQAGNNTMLAQVVGVIIGSPEYQRR